MTKTEELIQKTLDLDERRRRADVTLVGAVQVECNAYYREVAPRLAKLLKVAVDGLSHVVHESPTDHAVREWYSTCFNTLGKLDRIAKGHE